jgi:hypothetical protein
VRFKLAILKVLAKRPGGRATLDEVRRDVGIMIASGDRTEQLKRFYALGDVDIYRAGWVLQDHAGLLITDAGRSLLQSLGDTDGQSLEPSSARVSRPPGLTDDLTVTEESLRNFDHELRILDSNADDGDDDDGDHHADQDQQRRTVAIEAPFATSQIEANDLPESADPNVDEPSPAKKQSIFDVRPSYLAQEASLASSERKGLARHPGRAVIAFLTLALAVASVVAAIAFGQVQSLKSDILAQRRELASTKERIARLEQIEKEKRNADQQDETLNKSDAEKGKPTGETLTDQAKLNLSREEIQFIKDYIKPAPAQGAPAPEINVGDPVTGAMIPLPLQLTEKVPKLLGGKFMIRNGSIIVVKRASRQADVVVPAH